MKVVKKIIDDWIEALNNKIEELREVMPIISKLEFKKKCQSILNQNNQNDNNEDELNSFINNNLSMLKRSGEIIQFENNFDINSY